MPTFTSRELRRAASVETITAKRGLAITVSW